MFRTIKVKISSVYISLIIVIVILGAISLYNFHKISQSVDGLITTNYNSIERLTTMDAALNQQNLLMVLYIHADEVDCTDEFNAEKETFLETWHVEYDTIINPLELAYVKPAETDYINNIRIYYDEYVQMFDRLKWINTDTADGFERGVIYYETQVVPQMEQVRSEMQKLFHSNETSLFARKAEARNMVGTSSRVLVFLFAVAAIGGFLLARTYTNSLLGPIFELTQTIKSVRQGNLSRKMHIRTRDEVGQLADEFNNMMMRLSEFEKSTVGSLMEEKDKSFAILRSISEPLAILDANYCVELLNEKFEEHFAIDLKSAVGKPFTEALPSADLTKKISEIDYKTAEYKEAIVETVVHGEDKIFNVVFTPMTYSMTGQTAMIVIFHDITELKTLERVRSDFMATISHEFKTPLTSVLMGIDLMHNESVGLLNADQAEILATIQEDSQRLSNLVNDLLELSRIESAAMIYNFVACDIITIIKTSAKQFTPIAKKNQVTLSIVPGGKIPKVRVDFLKMTWVMNNLLSNAIKYTKAGDSITIRCWSVADSVYVSVSDTGMGIPKEFRTRIFDKFIQVYGCDIEVRGTGVGLAVTKEIITAHGGDVWCESTLNEGSSFTFVLNAAQ